MTLRLSAAAFLAALAFPLAADNPGAIAGVHGHTGRFVSLSLGLAPEVFPTYEGSERHRTYWFPLVDLEIGHGAWQVYAGASRNFVPLGQGVGVYPVHTPRWGWNVELARTDTRPESRGDALAGLGDRRANWFASSRVSWRFWPGHGQADLALQRGLRDEAGTLAFARVQLQGRSRDWYYAAAAKAYLSDAANLRYDFGVTPEQAAARQALVAAGDPRLSPGEVGPYLPGGGPRSADVTLSGGRDLGRRARAFVYAQSGLLLGNAADSPLVRHRNTYLLGAGVSVAVF